MVEREIEEQQPQTTEKEVTTDSVAAPKSPSQEPKGVLNGEWFVKAITEYGRTGEINAEGEDGFYLDTKDNYYSDPAVREALKEEFGTDDPKLIAAHYETFRKKYLSQTEDAHLDARNGAGAMMQRYKTGAGEDSSLLPSASFNQMRYDDGRLRVGDQDYGGEYSHRQGKTQKVITESGEVVYTNGIEDVDELLNDNRFLSKKGDRPIAFKYVGEQMYDESMGGAMVPVYDHEYQGDMIVSNWDIEGTTRIYKDSHGWNALAKTPLNFLISMFDQSIVGTMKEIGFLIHGEDSENQEYLTYLNNLSNRLKSAKFSGSDAAESITSMEGAVTMISEVALQILAMVGTGKLGAKGLKRLGVSAGRAEQSAAYMARLGMTTYAATTVGDQGRALGLSKRESAVAAFGAMGVLWASNSLFNWAESAIVQNSAIKAGTESAVKKALTAYGIGNRSVSSNVAAGESIGKTMLAHIRRATEAIKPSANNASRPMQILQGSVGETGQESFEFLGEELVKNVSNMYRYYVNEDERGGGEFKGYKWISDDDYGSYFVSGLGQSALGGFVGGGIAKPLIGFHGKIDDMMVYSIVEGRDDAVRSVFERFKKQQVFGDPSLSTIKNDEGEFMTIQEAREVDMDPIDQNTFNMQIIENEFNLKLRTLQALGLRGVGVNNYNKIMEKTPDLKKRINEYEVGKTLKVNYDQIQELMPKGVNPNEIVEIVEGVALLNSEYSQKLREAEEAQDTIKAEEERDEAVEEMATGLMEESKLSREDANKIITATQNIHDVINGKHAERVFIKTMYQWDKSLPAGDRQFTPLDGNKELESIDGIFKRQEVIAETRELNKSRAIKDYKTYENNEEVARGKGTLAEKMSNLKKIGNNYHMSQEALDALTSSIDLNPMKKNLIKTMESLTPEQYGEISPIFNMLLAITDQGQLKRMQMNIPAGVFNTSEDGTVTFDAEATLEERRKTFKTDVNAVKTQADFAKLSVEAIGMGMIAIEPVSFKLSKPLREMILGPASAATYNENPEDAEALMELNKLSKEGRFIGDAPAKWDDTDMDHLLTEYSQGTNGEFIPEEGSNLILSTELLKADSDANYNVDTDSTTFDDYNKVKELQAQLKERKALLTFSKESEIPLGQFRHSMTDLQLTSFKKQEAFDTELTRFNRVFQRMLYNPARRMALAVKAQKGGLSPTETTEQDKIDIINQKYVVEVLLQIDQSLADLDAIMETKLKQVSTDVAKKTNFKRFVGTLKNDTIQEITMALNTLSDISLDDFKLEAERIPEYANLFKLGDISSSEISDAEAQAMMKTVIAAKDKLYETHKGQQGKLLEAYKTMPLKDDQDIAQRLLYSMSASYSGFIGRYKGYVKLDEAGSTEAIFKFPANYAQFKASFEGFAFFVDELTQDTLKDMLILDRNLDITPEQVAQLSPTGMLAIIGKLGTGKTAFVGSLVLKISLDYMEQSGKKALIAAVVDEQIKTLTKSIDATHTELYPDKFIIGDNAKEGSRDNIITFLEEKREGTLSDAAVIVVDEATYINGTNYIHKTQGEQNAKKFDGPEFTSFNESITQINENRTALGIPRLRVLLMGDPYQGGSMTNRSDGTPNSSSILNNLYIPRTTYLREAERSQVRTLNQSIARTLKQAGGYVSLKTGKTDPLELVYGYDEGTNDILGVAVADSMDGLVTDRLGDLNKTTSEILLDKFKVNPKFEVAIISDVHKTVEDIIQDVPELAGLVNHPDYKDNFKVRTHREIQGGEVDFAIVHLDADNFEGEFGTNVDTAYHHMTTLATSIGRARFGAVVVNESSYDISSKYSVQDKKPPPSDIDSVVKSLRDFQSASFSGIESIDPIQGTIISKEEEVIEKGPEVVPPMKPEPTDIVEPLSKKDEVPLEGPLPELTPEEKAAVDKTIIRPLILFGHFPKVSPKNYKDYHRHIRTQLGAILKQDPKGRWGHSYTSGEAQYNVLVEIRDDATIPDESIRQAANAMLVYTHKVKRLAGMHAGDFIAKVSVGDDALSSASKRSKFLRDLDREGVLALNTETFKSFAPNVEQGLPSLIHTAKEILAPAGYTVAENSGEYREISRALLIGTNLIYKPTKFVTYAYESPDPKNPAVSVFLAAEYNGKMYVIGNFSNISKGQGPNLKKVQAVGQESLNRNGNIIGTWAPGVMVGTMFNPEKSLTPGRIIKGDARMNISEVEAKLDEYNLKAGPIQIITTPGTEHSGKAVMFYSSDLMDEFNNLELLYDENNKLSLGSLKGARGMILFDPGHISLKEFYETTQGTSLKPTSSDQRNPLIRSMSMSNISTNLTSAFAELSLAYMQRFPDHAYNGNSGDMQDLQYLRDETAMETWDPAQLDKLIDEVGNLTADKVPTPIQAAMRTILSEVTMPAGWTSYAFDESDGTILQNEAGTPRLEFSRGPITYAPKDEQSGGYKTSRIEFDIYKLTEAVSLAATNMATISVDGKEVSDLTQKISVIFGAIDDMLSRFNNKEFSHGIRVLPIIAPTIAGATDLDRDISLADITDFSRERLTAPVGSFQPPLVYIQATVGDRNIWDREDYQVASEQEEEVSEERLEDITVNNTVLDSEELLTEDGFTAAMKKAGIETEFFAIQEYEAQVDKLEDIEELLREDFIDKGFDTQLNIYLEELGKRVIDNKEFTGMTPEADTISDVTLSNVIDKYFAGKSDEDVALAIQITSGLSFLDAFSTVLLTHEDQQQGITLLAQLRDQVINSGFDPATQVALNSLLEPINSTYVNAKIDGNMTDYEVKINKVLDDTQSVDLSLFLGMEWSMPQEGDSLSQMMLAYATIPTDMENAATVKQVIRGLIQRRDISMYQRVLELPIIDAADLNEVFTTSVIKGDVSKVNEINYTAKQRVFMDQVLKQLVNPEPVTDIAVQDAVELVGALMQPGVDPVAALKASPIANLFNLHDLGVYATLEPGQGTVSNIRLDTYFLKQHKELLLKLLDDPKILKFIKADLTSIQEDITQTTEDNLTLINDAFLGEKATWDTAQMLDDILNDEATLFLNPIDIIVNKIVATKKASAEKKGKKLSKGDQGDIKARVEDLVKRAFYYKQLVPSAQSTSASSLLGMLKKNLLPAITEDKDQQAMLEASLQNNLITEPGEHSRIIC